MSEPVRYLLPLALLLLLPKPSDAEDNQWSASAATSYSSDSDTIIFYKESLQSEYRFSDTRSFKAVVENIQMQADQSSGLTTVRGDEDVHVRGGLFGLKQQVSDDFSLEMMGGFQQSTAGTNTPAYTVKAINHLTDTMQGILTVSREMHTLSPKAISLDIARTEGTLQLVWQASKKLRLEGSTSYADFTDDNSRRSFLLSPLYRAFQDNKASLDAGFRFQWYGYEKRLFDGYYSPESYQAYNVPVVYYWEFGNSHSAMLSFAPGIYKDQNIEHFKFAGDVLAEANFKINDIWDFNMHAGFVRSGGVTSSDYDQRLAGIGLIHRF
jgi:hypothetical protein